ncbi:MAG: bifunctional diaminohydroxyphosphoribosylaminopyrimidine deaminase/5-amino-6-(5-phosphoribosylamino)uracil reductase RibD [Rhodospirillaceae bacterium]|nr:bifunctional diaminohydroxyphosphoribosylaminopyrimidine deaminase/5-amino-6-(5-phosphoribosylamino)uracil reductase RibD [Rhodospirillaceae bacterium]
MQAALALARRGLGRVWPNPAVGCIILRPGPDGDASRDVVVGRGWTQPGGRPHAETEALARAAAATEGATAYVSLEPCAHHGRTPPCADALVAARIARCVIAAPDPDPRVNGAGVERLKAAGIETVVGLCRDEAEEINAGFFARIRLGRPLVTLKLATTLDGRIATHGGRSRWITGEAARARTHLMRAQHDAIMVGAGTALADDPELTCRVPGLEDRSPVRVVMDAHLRLPLTARLVAGAAAVPTWIITQEGVDPVRRRAFEDCGVTVIEAPLDADGNLSLPAALALLGERGITRLLVEGGSRLSAALLRADLVDRLAWFRAARILGGDGLPAAAALGIDRLDQAPAFVPTGVVRVGEDVLETYRRRAQL